MRDNIYVRAPASRWRAAGDIMDTPKKALNVARVAAWVAFGLALSSAVQVVRWIGVGGAGVILAARPAALETAELVAAIIAGALAYLRPATWSTSLVLGLLALDAAYHLLSRGFDSTLAVDVFGALVAMMSFVGVRRYANLRATEAASQHSENVFT